jgi:streptogramin lyase
LRTDQDDGAAFAPPVGDLHRVDKIARFNPKTNEWLELPLPQAETDVQRIEIDPTNPNRVYWSGVAYNARIGYVELLN